MVHLVVFLESLQLYQAMVLQMLLMERLGTTATTILAGNTTFMEHKSFCKPTTISGYGITDAFSGAFSSLSRYSYVSGYGITDPIALTNADIDIGSNDFITTGKVLFANMYSALSDLPSATTYHGMFAHVHATGAAYFHMQETG